MEKHTCKLCFHSFSRGPSARRPHALPCPRCGNRCCHGGGGGTNRSRRISPNGWFVGLGRSGSRERDGFLPSRFFGNNEDHPPAIQAVAPLVGRPASGGARRAGVFVHCLPHHVRRGDSSQYHDALP
ncbi:hypothetical protein AXF42_Ash020599 [Apostasia shenzhenica]|uniref:Uncharacterized protein n=1 Tax=Apostasia shenzhenica TaxID=1088818 RepID=A0A2I0A0E3_9ASPA|nr:hypothetical protein AXF42_Ash020599 [Apostasia shenzhenica]